MSLKFSERRIFAGLLVTALVAVILFTLRSRTRSEHATEGAIMAATKILIYSDTPSPEDRVLLLKYRAVLQASIDRRDSKDDEKVKSRGYLIGEIDRRLNPKAPEPRESDGRRSAERPNARP